MCGRHWRSALDRSQDTQRGASRNPFSITPPVPRRLGECASRRRGCLSSLQPARRDSLQLLNKNSFSHPSSLPSVRGAVGSPAFSLPFSAAFCFALRGSCVDSEKIQPARNRERSVPLQLPAPQGRRSVAASRWHPKPSTRQPGIVNPRVRSPKKCDKRGDIA
jgi:hypothetical protein